MIDNRGTAGELPAGWVRTQLGDVCLKPQYGWTTSAATEGSVRLLRTTDITSGPIDWDTLPFCTKQPPEKLKYLVQDGDIVVARAGSVGVSQLIRNPQEAVFASYLIRFRPLIDERYVAYFLESPSYWDAISERSAGIAVPNVNATKLANIHFPLPPTAERQRIVAKIEELFSQLDAGVAALEKAKVQLQRYRRAVLRAAMEGELTREWRQAHKHELEPASALLEHILQERRARWEAQQLEKMKAKGGVPRHDKWKEKYKEPWRPPAHELPPVAAGWTWTSFQELAQATPHALKAGPFGSSLKKEYYVPSGYKIYGQEQVIRGDPFYGDYYVDEDRYRRLRPCAVKPGDVLVSLVGTIGKVLILPDDIQPGIINPRLVKLTLDKRIVRPRYVEAYLQSASVRQYFSLSSHGGTMDILNLTILKALPVALPPLEEQDAILGEVDRRMSIADQMDAGVEDDLVRSARLRQSILKRAFEGNLVPQDPTDEPASLLLERIKAEKAERETQAKRKRRRPKKNEPDQPTLFWKKDLHAQRAQPTRHHTQSTMHPG